MINKLLIIWFLIKTSLLYGQFYENNDRRFVFSEEANIREKDDLNAKIIGILTHGTEIVICDEERSTDTINNRIDYWYKILYKNSVGYIWGNTLANNNFIHSNGNRILVKNDAQVIKYKVFLKDSLINKGEFKDKPYERYSYFNNVLPLHAVKEKLYFKLRDSDLIYSFDGLNVNFDSRCEKENIHSLHLSSQKKVQDSITSYIIIGDNVNFREDPNLNSKIIGSLSKYTFVEFIEESKKRDVINDEHNYWYKIKWKEKVGYIWGKSISIPRMYIYDNDDTNTTYLLGNNALFVFYKGEIKASFNLNNNWGYGESIQSFGDLGFGEGYDFIAIEHISHSCGHWGGDQFFLWNGSNIKFFCSSGGIGDGGFSEGTHFIFPSEQNGIPNQMVLHSYESESIDICPIDDCEENYINLTDNQYTSIMRFNGDSLIEVKSKHLDLKDLIKSEFPSFKLIKYEFGDINNDSIEDVIFFTRKSLENNNPNGYYDISYKTKIGIAIGKKDSTFEILSVNEHLIDKEDDYRLSLQIKNSNIIVTTYIENESNYEKRMSGYDRKIYDFSFSSTEQKIYWNSVTLVNKNGINKSTFKTKRVLFENAWSFKANGEENW